mgnify:CR=1 FL=1
MLDIPAALEADDIVHIDLDLPPSRRDTRQSLRMTGQDAFPRRDLVALFKLVISTRISESPTCSRLKIAFRILSIPLPIPGIVV